MNPQVKCPWLFHENWVEIGLVANKKNNNRSSPIFIHFPWESCVLWAIRPGQLQPLRPEVWQGHPEPLVLFGMPFMGSCWVLKSIEIQPQPSLWTNFDRHFSPDVNVTPQSRQGTDREMTLAYVDILDYCKAPEASLGPGNWPPLPSSAPSAPLQNWVIKPQLPMLIAVAGDGEYTAPCPGVRGSAAELGAEEWAPRVSYRTWLVRRLDISRSIFDHVSVGLKPQSRPSRINPGG